MPSERAVRPPQPLPSDTLEQQLAGWVMRTMGFVLVVLAVAGWLSLATWSVSDPNFSRAIGGDVLNWLGPIGAIVSDLSLQTLGLTAIVLFLGPAAAGIELMRTGELVRPRLRLLLWPVSLAILGGALSAPPTPNAWPLINGLGGIVGDAVHGFAAGALASIEIPRAGGVAGLALLIAGLTLVSVHLNLSARHWLEFISGRKLFRTAAPQPEEPGAEDGKRRRLLASLPPVSLPTWRWSRSKPDDRADIDELDAHWEPRLPRLAPIPELDAPLSVAPPALVVENRRRHDRPIDPDVPFSGGGRKFAVVGGLDHDDPDDSLTRSSRAMAHRFAPESAATSAALASIGAMSMGTAAQSGGARRQRSAPTWRLPSLNLLTRPTAPRRGADATSQVLRGSARLLEDVLADFAIKGEVKAIKPGPVVTLFELEVARGTKAARVVSLADDIARSMSASSARIAPVAGRATIGVELPNVRRETVHLRELLESEPWRTTQARLPVALGKKIDGEPVIADLAAMPHLLVAGTTGSGKSVGLNAMILSLLYRLGPEQCRMLMIDPKMLELSVYNRIPHLLAPVVTDPALAAEALRWAVSEMEDRLRRISGIGARNIDAFNERLRVLREHEAAGEDADDGLGGDDVGDMRTAPADLTHMPYLVIVIDELADLMAVAGKDVESSLQRLAQMARAAGIHLVAATQRPSVDVITGTVKANFPTRIAFRVASKIDSRTILDEQGAEQLLGSGDMLFASGPGRNVRVHGPFVSDQEVESVATALRHQRAPKYSKSLEAALGAPLVQPGPSASRRSGADDLYDRAVAVLHRDRRASASWLQKRLGIGADRAAGLVQRMQAEGLIPPTDGPGRRVTKSREGSSDSAA
jgi:DNA segregation ATPase FtsK/SpoIIIE, S-DNA-T family